MIQNSGSEHSELYEHSDLKNSQMNIMMNILMKWMFWWMFWLRLIYLKFI